MFSLVKLFYYLEFKFKDNFEIYEIEFLYVYWILFNKCLNENYKWEDIEKIYILILRL